MPEIYIFQDRLDYKRERTLSAYPYSKENPDADRAVHILVNDPIYWDPKKDGAMPLFLHSMDIASGHEELVTIGLHYLIDYARKRGYPAILATGKSSTLSEQAAEDQLLAAGFEKRNYRRYWMELA